jgi:hypothetical protein
MKPKAIEYPVYIGVCLSCDTRRTFGNHSENTRKTIGASSENTRSKLGAGLRSIWPLIFFHILEILLICKLLSMGLF